MAGLGVKGMFQTMIACFHEDRLQMLLQNCWMKAARELTIINYNCTDYQSVSNLVIFVGKLLRNFW